MPPAEPSPQSLSWSFNPWQQGLGGWRRPQLALPVSILLAVLLSWSVCVPNTPQSMEQALRSRLAEMGSAPFAVIDGKQFSRSDLEEQLSQIEAQREQFPGQWLLWSVLTSLMILGMTASLYLPVQYRLDERGITVRFAGVPSMRRWEHYRNFYPHRLLVHMSTLPQPSALDPFRGHSLIFNGNREEVLAFISAHVVSGKGPRTRTRDPDQGPGIRDQGPGTRKDIGEAGPGSGTRDQGPGTRDQIVVA